jgi:mRNA interferase HicA
VKRRDLEARLRALGWVLARHGGRHDVWTDGERLEYVPRHSEIGDLLARKILEKAASPRRNDS